VRQPEKFWRDRDKKYFRVDRRLYNNTIFVIIEDENPKQPTYRIENYSKQFSLKYHQVEQSKYTEVLSLNQMASFAWEDPQGIHELEVEFLSGDVDENNAKAIPNVSRRFPLDQLNVKEVIALPVSRHMTLMVYVSTFTNGYTKVIRFSDKQTSQSMSHLDQFEEVKDLDENAIPMSIYEIYMKQLNFSIIGSKKELLTMYWQRIEAKVVDTEQDLKCEF